MNYHKLREWLSEQEHIQWEHWSKRLAYELQLVSDLLNEYINKPKKAREIIKARLNKWKKNWKPYKNLKESIKDFDREWADKIIDNLPFKCPVYQCGGIMITVERKPPKGLKKTSNGDFYGYNGDEQTPDLICSNCNSIYQFKGFSKFRRASQSIDKTKPTEVNRNGKCSTTKCVSKKNSTPTK